MHPIWIILISVSISLIISFWMVSISKNGLKHELEIERRIREEFKRREELDAIMIQILEHPITLVKNNPEENKSKDIDDDSSTEW